MKITYAGHSCFLIEVNGKTIITDPFCQNPGAVIRKEPKFADPDFIVVSHGHGDHIGSISDFAGRNTTVVGIVELCSFLVRKGIRKTVGLNIGGKTTTDGITFALTPALHSSSDSGIYLGEPTGLIIKADKHTVYHAGDTDVFGDMALIEKFYHPTVGLMPIGGFYTMNAEKAAYACNEFFDFKTVIPMHYNTFSNIKADPKMFTTALKKHNGVIMEPLDSITIE